MTYVCDMITMENEIDKDKLEKVAFVLKTIGHPVRLGIIGLLANNTQISVNEISEKLNCEQSIISHHLNNMKVKGILQSTRVGKSNYYSIKLMEVMTVINCMSKCNI
jgi:ArsR family transcriptional regulator